ncbi:MAG: hypothetical protein EAY75_15050 [Bacteroidetes bacterium]|nr:MAG: hypothetical protein EAY75_15050 [Bacteroidota bacterium]
MTKVAVSMGQSVLDVAVQIAGSPLAAWQLALANGISITAGLTVGQQLLSVSVVDARVVAYLEKRLHRPATALVQSADATADGIGVWILESDFVVQ